MVTRVVPGGYKPELGAEDTVTHVRRAVEGLGDLIDGYEFHYPQEINEDNLEAVTEALDGHDIYCVASGMHLDPRFGRGGMTAPDAATRAEAVRRTLAGVDFAGRVGAHFVIGTGSRLQPPFGAFREGRVFPRTARPDLPPARRHPAPEQGRAGDEDPHAQHQHDPARDPHPAPPGPRQRQGQHGLAAPDQTGGWPGTPRCWAPRACWSQHGNSGWGTFDDDNMVGATAFMEP
jgi:xylose isomerase